MLINRRKALMGMAGAGLSGFGLPSLAAAVQAAATPYRRPRLKITDVRTAEIRGHGYQLRHLRRSRAAQPSPTSWFSKGIGCPGWNCGRGS